MAKRNRTNSLQLEDAQLLSTLAQTAEADPEALDRLQKVSRKFSCPYPPAIVCSEKPLCNSVPFNSFEAYEVHYLQAHTNRCMECHRNFPTEHLLHLHIRENHDPFWSIQVQKGEKMFGCFVEGCDKMCRSSLTRRNHLIDKHYFPPNYDWNMINSGVDKRQSMLSNPHNKVRNPSPGKKKPIPQATQAKTAPDADEPIRELSGLMTGMKLVPRTIRFGRR